MANWKVFREKIEILPHPNAEKLEIGKIGEYPIVFQKGLYKEGETIIFIPSKSILPDGIKEHFQPYLKGPGNDRVGAIALRGEPSTGVVIPDREEFKDVPFGEDISERLGIVEYVAPIPAALAGEILQEQIGYPYRKHDVEQFTINANNFDEGEEVIATEKVHGSQIWTYFSPAGDAYVSSKGRIKSGYLIKENEGNAYWDAIKSISLKELVAQNFPEKNVQVFLELIPCQGGYSYGASKTTAVIYRIDVEGEKISYDSIPEDFRKFWSPLIYRGPFDVERLKKASEGKEQVSGKELHIKEGIVVEPVIPRKDKRGNFQLLLKVINPKYKETGEEIN